MNAEWDPITESFDVERTDPDDQEPDDRTRYESHAWSGGDECVACGVTWEDCDDECPDDQRPPQPANSSECPNGCDLRTYRGTHAEDCPLLPDPQPVGYCSCVYRPERSCEIPSHRAAARAEARTDTTGDGQ